MSGEDKEMHRRIKAVKSIVDNPDRWPTSIHAAAVRKLTRLREIIEVN